MEGEEQEPEPYRAMEAQQGEAAATWQMISWTLPMSEKASYPVAVRHQGEAVDIEHDLGQR